MLDFSNENVKEYVVADRNRSNQYYQEVISPMLQERSLVTNADVDYYNEIFPKLAQSSTYVSTDVKNTIEWALPSLMKIFFGSNDIVSIDPKEPEDAQKANIMKKLINYQLTRENNGFMVFYNWFKDAYEFGLGVTKAYWIRETTKTIREEVFDNRRLQEVMAAVEVLGIEPYTETTSKVKYRTEITVANRPKLENIMPSDFRFLPNYANLQSCPFVAQIVYMTGSELKQKEQDGVFANVDKATPNTAGTALIGLNDPLRQYESDYFSGTYGSDGSWVGDKSRQIYEVWECYGKYDVNNDGISENVIITLCGDTVLRMEENTYGILPFFTLSPMHEQYRIMPKSSYADLIKPIQDLKTAFHRLMVRGLAVSNDPLTVVDPTGIEIQDVLDGNSFVRTRNNRSPRDSYVQMTPTQINPQTFSYIEMLEGDKENRTGVTRYNQGLDAKTLNPTATGVTAIMNASNQRLELNARIFAETGIQDLFRHMIRMNQQYISNEFTLRLTNEVLQISPDDLSGDFDLVVSAGVGIISQEAMQRALQQNLAMVMQVGQMGVQIATPDNIYNTVAKMLQELGIKDVSPYITSPEIIQQQQQAQQQAQLEQILPQLPQLIQQITDQVIQGATPEQQQQLVQYMQQSGGQMPQELIQAVLGQFQQLEQQGQLPHGVTELVQQNIGA